MSAEIMKHRRIVHPSPTGDYWRMTCTCGWEGSIALAEMEGSTAGKVQDTLEILFVKHLPQNCRQLYVLIDRREGIEGQWLMPEGTPCTFENFDGDAGGGFFVELETPVKGRFPVGEVRTAAGQVFRLE